MILRNPDLNFQAWLTNALLLFTFTFAFLDSTNQCGENQSQKKKTSNLTGYEKNKSEKQKYIVKQALLEISKYLDLILKFKQKI